MDSRSDVDRIALGKLIDASRLQSAFAEDRRGEGPSHRRRKCVAEPFSRPELRRAVQASTLFGGMGARKYPPRPPKSIVEV
jgi:hypothetical protein